MTWCLHLVTHQFCRRRSKSDPPRRSNIDPGMDADRVMVGCGQVKVYACFVDLPVAVLFARGKT